MSFADIAHHLIDVDRAYMAALEAGTLGKNLGRAGAKDIRDRSQYDQLIAELESLKETRYEFIISLDTGKLGKRISCDRIAGKVEADFGTVLFWLLDHEIQQRGMLIVYLKLLEGGRGG